MIAHISTGRDVAGVFILLVVCSAAALLLAYCSHRSHEIPEVEISAEPSPASMPTGLPVPQGSRP